VQGVIDHQTVFEHFVVVVKVVRKSEGNGEQSRRLWGELRARGVCAAHNDREFGERGVVESVLAQKGIEAALCTDVGELNVGHVIRDGAAIARGGEHKTARTRIWRALKASGAAALRDGVYLLPKSESARVVFAEQAQEVVAAGGMAHIVAFDGEDDAQHREFVRLFDRSTDYAELF